MREVIAAAAWIAFCALVALWVVYAVPVEANQERDQAVLWAWAKEITGRDGQKPAVIWAARSFLREKACAGRPCNVLGWYDGRHVYLHQGLDLNDPKDASILLHEFAHHLYGDIGAHGCAAAMEAERRAYHAQTEYLLRNGSLATIFVGSSMHGAGCQE